jgi:phenylacetate-CoA ligase
MEDLFYRFLYLYNRLPSNIKYLIGKIYYYFPASLKYGKFYQTYLKRVKFFMSIDDVQMVNQNQEKLLFENVNDAIRNIPFYKKYQPVNSVKQFQALPITNKKTIKENFCDHVNPALHYKKLTTNTGGSSGTPFEFFLEKKSSRPKEKSHFDWFWGQFGYKTSDKVLMVRGMPLRKNGIFEYRSLDNHLNVSCYLINEKNILQVLNAINEFKPTIIHAYPSSLRIVTSLLETYKDRLDINIRSIFVGSEYLSDFDRNYFESFYNAKVISWYGHTERLLHGGNCHHSGEFHFYPFYGYLELIDEKNNVITEPGREGRIVATGFDNRVMPFIRYDTGDIGVLSDETECACGFKGKTLKSITGRFQDTIVLSDGTNVSLTAFIFGQHLKEFSKIRELQVYQKKMGEVEIRIVQNKSFSSSEEKSIIETLSNSVNHKLEIKIKFVEQLAKTSTGKHRFFISAIDN